MRILLTNDDGIEAAGIRALWQELSSWADVIVAAPDREHSATSQAITVSHPIRVDRYAIEGCGIKAWRIGGTPTDCVKVALEALLSEPPDLIVSGINHGANLGTDVLYSGTVSAAMEGALHGIPSVAVSLDSWSHCDFAPAARVTRRLLSEGLLRHSLPPGALFNINVPALPEEKLQGVAITKLGVRQYANTFERRLDPRGRIYYWMGGQVLDINPDESSDIAAVKRGQISLTPLQMDMTDHTLLATLKTWEFPRKENAPPAAK